MPCDEGTGTTTAELQAESLLVLAELEPGAVFGYKPGDGQCLPSGLRNNGFGRAPHLGASTDGGFRFFWRRRGLLAGWCLRCKERADSRASGRDRVGG